MINLSQNVINWHAKSFDEKSLLSSTADLCRKLGELTVQSLDIELDLFDNRVLNL